MGFRFRRSVRLAPGFRINLSKTGASLSVGRRGARVNLSERGTKATAGLPGSGLSYSTMLSRPPGGGSALGTAVWVTVGLALVVALLRFVAG
jgi:uncharacterized protein DUF4236